MTMKTGGYAAHLASMKAASTPAQTPEQPAGHLRMLASSSDVVFGHREKITAGVPGCTCGKTYPDDAHKFSAVLHAHHVADELVPHVLAAAVAAIQADQEDFARDPERWSAGSHDSTAAIEAIVKMVRRETEPAQTKETTTA